MARRKKRDSKGRQKKLTEDQKNYKKRRAASRLTPEGHLKTGEDKARMKRARAAQKVSKKLKEEEKDTFVHVANEELQGKYGYNKIAPKARGRKSSVKLTEVPEKYRDAYGRISYNPQSIRAAFKDRPEDITKEYTRLRSAAVKRLARLEGAGFGGSQTAKYYRTKLPKIQGMSRADIDKYIIEMMVDVNRFLASVLSTVKGQVELKNQRILALREYGYEVDWSNFDYLTDVLDYIRDEYQDLFFDSDQLIQDAVKYINEVINDPEIMKMAREEHGTDQAGQTLGDEVYERFAASSAELRGLSGL